MRNTPLKGYKRKLTNLSRKEYANEFSNLSYTQKRKLMRKVGMKAL